MVLTTGTALDMFNAVLEMHHMDRSEVVMNLVREWVIGHVEQDLHTHIKTAWV